MMEQKTEIVLSILSYSFCSGTLVLLNKMILAHWPYPSLVSSFQLVATLCFIFGAKWTGYLTVDPVVWKHVAPYSYYIVGFALGVYCNMKSLSLSNVETVIVFKALSPCVVAFADAIFLGREYPNVRSWSALALIVVGAYGYASYDAKFQQQGVAAYTWPFLYLLTISFEMTYGKRIVGTVDLKTRSGPVLYVNLLGLAPMLGFAAAGHEYQALYQDRIHGFHPVTVAACFLMALGCIAGTGIGYSSWWCRDMVSATSFSLIGVMNKCLTILLNVIVWDQHAPPGGIASLVLCLVGGALYQQAPMRRVGAGGLLSSSPSSPKYSKLSKDKGTDLLEPDHHDSADWENGLELEEEQRDSSGSTNNSDRP